MRPRMVLHIGVNKTGTGSIQTFFNRQRQSLLTLGVLYPTAGCRGHFHHPLSHLLGFGQQEKMTKEVRQERCEALKVSLLEEVERHSPQTTVISSEYFMLPRKILPVVEFFRDFDVKVVVYLRRHDHWRESAYKQGLKTVVQPLHDGGFDAWLQYQQSKNSRYGDYRLLVDTWAQAFGKDNIIVRPFERQQNQPDIVTDFLISTGMSDVAEQVDVSVPRINEGLSNRAVRLLEVVQRMTLDPAKRKQILTYALQMPRDSEHASLASPAVRRSLVERNLDDYSYIAREYLDRDDGQLFCEELPELDEQWSAPPLLSQLDVTQEIENSITYHRAGLSWSRRWAAILRGVFGKR